LEEVLVDTGETLPASRSSNKYPVSLLPQLQDLLCIGVLAHLADHAGYYLGDVSGWIER
jgi:hypothetical protein